MDKSLCVVMPVFNEEECLAQVVQEWMVQLHLVVKDNFQMIIVDDGSTDSTPQVLSELKIKWPELQIHQQENMGHGQACLTAYRLALNEQPEWILQIDSDGQCAPYFFLDFWNKRECGDAIYGFRRSREDGWIRLFISRFLSFFVFASTRTWVNDPNVPFRLIKFDTLRGIVSQIPQRFYMANILVAVLHERNHGIYWIDISFRRRLTKDSRTRFLYFVKNAYRLWQDFRVYFNA